MHFARRLARNDPTETNEDLSPFRLGDAGAHMIGEALRGNTTLVKLNLLGNAIGAAGAHTIGEALRENSAIVELHLDSNHIEDAGLQTIQDLIAEKRIARKAARLAAQLIVPCMNLIIKGTIHDLERS